MSGTELILARFISINFHCSNSSLPSRNKKANIVNFISQGNDKMSLSLNVDSNGYLEIRNDAGKIKERLRPKVNTRNWYWVEISQVYKEGKKKVGSNKINTYIDNPN